MSGSATAKLLQPSLFPESELAELEREEKNKMLREKETQREKLTAEIWEHAQLIQIVNPKTDNDLMINYQYQFIKNKDENARGQLWLLAYKTTTNLLKGRVVREGLPLDAIEQEERISLAVEYVMRRYTTRAGYYVKKNFIKALNDGVTHALHYQRKFESDLKKGIEELNRQRVKK